MASFTEFEKEADIGFIFRVSGPRKITSILYYITNIIITIITNIIITIITNIIITTTIIYIIIINDIIIIIL